MKKILVTILMIFGLLIASQSARADGKFTGTVSYVQIDNGNVYDGTPYLEVVLSDITTLDGTLSYDGYFALPLLGDNTFPYMFAILSKAQKSKQKVLIVSKGTWTRSDGTVYDLLTLVRQYE